MPVDTSPSRVATQQLQSIPFGSLIGAPLDAAITAQAQAALTTVNFIQSVGLQKNENEEWEAIVVTFTYQDSSGITRNLVIPLLAIVTVPYLAIDDITIDFKANISAESSTSLTTTTSTEFSASADVSINYWFVKANFKASYSSKKDSTATASSKYSVEYTMDVRVHASQADMPAGLTTVLQILQESIVARDPTGNLVVTMNNAPRFNEVGETLTVTIVAVNGDNRGVGAVAITMTSSDTSLVDVTTAPPATNNYGMTTGVLTCTGVPADGPATVTIEIKGTVANVEHVDTFDIVVG